MTMPPSLKGYPVAHPAPAGVASMDALNRSCRSQHGVGVNKLSHPVGRVMEPRLFAPSNCTVK